MNEGPCVACNKSSHMCSCTALERSAARACRQRIVETARALMLASLGGEDITCNADTIKWAFSSAEQFEAAAREYLKQGKV